MKNNIIKKTLSVILFTLLILILVYNIVLISQSIINPTETPSFFGIKTYTIISGSMKPEINIGDIVVVKEVSDNELRINDIVAYRNGQNVVTHRIVDMRNPNGEIEYITKGDNNNTTDDIVLTTELIEGKVVKRIKYLGNVVILLQEKLSIIIIMITFFIYILSRKNKKEDLINNDSQNTTVNS